MSDALSPLERSVLDHLDADVLVESLVELVRIPSVGGSDAEIEVQEHVAQVLRDLDTDVDRWDIDLDEMTADPWFPGVEVERSAAVGVVGTTTGEGAPGLVLCGHTDVVPPGDVETWGLSDPFSAEIRDNALFGRGACDMKAGVAANLAVARTLRDSGVRLERPLAVHAVIGEEDGGLGCVRHPEARSPRGRRGDHRADQRPADHGHSRGAHVPDRGDRPVRARLDARARASAPSRRSCRSMPR